MIISEKQIMQLIEIARQAITYHEPKSDYRSSIVDLLTDIVAQQSEELKEVL